MLQIDSAIPYCIGAREVTNAEYLSFLSERAGEWPVSKQPPECDFNLSFEPEESCNSTLHDPVSAAVAVHCVDYCDARSYCESLGQHLCSRMGGAPNPIADVASLEADQWYFACAGEDELTYPYGDEFAGDLCNGSEFSPTNLGPKSSGKMPNCTGSVSALQQMSGNVSEWTNACDGESCAARGGSFDDGPYELRCAGAQRLERNTQSRNVGFRCCGELAP
jgi:formylglycine-generating enzyme required for sulfatase activity